MKGLQPPTILILLFFLLSVNGEQEDTVANVEVVETDSTSSEEANPSEIGDQLGTSEEEACSDCEDTSDITDTSKNSTELKVVESATYSMASVGSTSIFVRLDRVEGKENLQMVCQ